MVLPSLMDVVHQIDAMLPTFNPTVTAMLHLLALAGLAFAFDPDIVSFKGNRVRVLGSYVKDWQAALGVLVLLGVLAFYNRWIELLYGRTILNGQGALGVLVAEVPLIILRKSQRRMNLFWGGLIALGGFLVYLSFV
ncbi:hypothetical protein HT576_11565 [Haloterrigena sp. SYSU A121-1]|uniref:Uncharacterized protein n=1 Tax=Haloterrigena gelatinilytica TaxID=2741724 RepID=A0A8J8GL51_9EURY|nr:hypothetical protein [Haloterrigena gelatinilytica]NUB91651.1 hypothetical protein [Haloterrigena gelatinilytica]